MSTFTKLPWVGTLLRRNLHTNPSLDVNATGYGSTAGTFVGRQANGGVDDGPCGYLEITSELGTVAAFHTNITVAAGEEYAVSAKVRASVGALGRPAAIRLTWSSGSTVGVATPLTASFQTISHVAVVPAGVTTMRVDILITGAGVVGQRTLFDQTLVEKTGTMQPYFDGNTADTTRLRYDWDGTAGSSTSSLREPTAAESLTPLLVKAPWQATRKPTGVVHRLLDAPDVVRIFNRRPGPKRGTLQLYFPTAGAAAAALDWFAENTGGFAFDGADVALMTLTRAYLDPDGDELTIGQHEDLLIGDVVGDLFPSDDLFPADDLFPGGRGFLWTVTIPWIEVPA